VVAPLLTAYFYHGWMHRPSSILTRWKRDLLPADIVSGAVVAAVIIISFLSLMSFADFLRVHWQQPPAARRGEENEDRRQGAAGANNGMANMINGFADDIIAENNNNAENMFVDNAIVNFAGALLPGFLRGGQADLQGAMQEDEQESDEDYSDHDDDDDAEDTDDDSDEVHRERIEHRIVLPQEDDQHQRLLQAQAALGNELAQQRERRRQMRAAPPQHQPANDVLAAGNERLEPLRDEERNDRENIDNAQDQDMFADEPLPPLLPDARDSDDEDSDNDAPPFIFQGDVNDEDADSDDDNEEDNRDDEPLFPPLRNEERMERPFDPMEPVMQDDQVVSQILDLEIYFVSTPRSSHPALTWYRTWR
jgi:hypothetical protein